VLQRPPAGRAAAAAAVELLVLVLAGLQVFQVLLRGGFRVRARTRLRLRLRLRLRVLWPLGRAHL